MIQSSAFADSSDHVVCCAVRPNPQNQRFWAAKLYDNNSGEHCDLHGECYKVLILLSVLYGCVGKGPNTTISFPCDPRAALPIWLKRAACGFP